VVQRGNEKQVLNQPYATTRNGDAVQVLAAADVKETFGSTLQALPARPTIFLLYFTTGTDQLTAQRAETVKGFLVGIGIAAERIQTAGRGKREPIVQTGDNVDEPKNRRVEINVR